MEVEKQEQQQQEYFPCSLVEVRQVNENGIFADGRLATLKYLTKIDFPLKSNAKRSKEKKNKKKDTTKLSVAPKKKKLPAKKLDVQREVALTDIAIPRDVTSATDVQIEVVSTKSSPLTDVFATNVQEFKKTPE